MADSKTTALTADTSVDSADLGYTVEDPGGTPVSKKATWLNILKGAALGVLTSDGDLFTRTSGALARLTRASLAADSAFSTVYAPIDYAGKLLAVVKNTTGGNQSTTSASLADVDATNAAVTFTAPASGKVLFRVTCTGNLPGSTNVNTFFGVREGTTNLVNGTTGTQFIQSQANDSGGDAVVAWCAYITGISAGSHTYKVAFAVNSGVSFTVRAAAASPMTIEVWAAP